MTLEDVTNNKAQIKCFWCLSLLGNFPAAKFIAICGEEGIIIIRNAQTGHPEPMVFCSSDCMVIDSYYRYQDRVARGAFRKQFDTKYQDSHQLPERWRKDKDGTDGVDEKLVKS